MILPGITRSPLSNCSSTGRTGRRTQSDDRRTRRSVSPGQGRRSLRTGTAAVISPIGELEYEGEKMVFNNGEIGPYSQKLYDTMFGIQTGKVPDDLNWTVPLDPADEKRTERENRICRYQFNQSETDEGRGVINVSSLCFCKPGIQK